MPDSTRPPALSTRQSVSVRGLVIDLDGVVYVGHQALPGAAEFFATLRSRGVPFLLMTNNSTQTAAQYQDKLGRMGIEVSEGEVLTSAEATAQYLARRAAPAARVLVIGEHGLCQALAGQGFLLNEPQPEWVVMGLDRAFDYEKLTRAVRAVGAGAHLVAANPDLTLPVEDGVLPGAGSLLAAVVAATQVTPVVIGKPEPTMFQLAAEQLGLQPSQVAVVGDRLDTDIAGARRAGMVGILVLTGVSSEADVASSPEPPDAVVKDLDGLAALLFAEGTGG